MRLAALFVQPDGCYAALPDVDAWPEHRDARRYNGPLPVVAHPPCQLWGAMAVVNYARWGGEHNRPGNDGGCFAAALKSVRRFGGVLEHPAKTKAWATHGLARPAATGWQRTIDGGWVCEVWQSAYGHRANKATWLYYHGTNPPFELRWERPEGTHQIGFHDQRGKAANKPTLGKREANKPTLGKREANKPTLGKREANATPIEFRDELMRLAMKAHNALDQADAACGVSPGATG
ncbi:hypothetical protein GBK02_09010 [Dechloromonas sp. TW-R-39-2]|uniref:hypothetical protein n=1 Tax=Dechloromonas sp. TW-R-39-2 TaxID=2654218 RepID=UPI00193D65BF|nr:hypothetical protein [Dechloromonas sp. TW-R-39-2]QRM19530.1 hypothetical protein GBK02_09010 [Dechloromonas sp. TW-R-39-2]